MSGNPDLPSIAPIPVLYIGGEGRSGSTVLSSVLGNHEGLFPVGELPDVWQALRTNELCTCGTAFLDCEFWGEVGRRAFGGWKNVDADEVIAQAEYYTRHRRIPRLLQWSRRPVRDPEFVRYCGRLALLYDAIRAVSGCAMIVDSTKSPPHAVLLRSVRPITLRVVHLVRDSRGVAFSWMKTAVANPQYANNPALRDKPMATVPAWKMALTWDLKNLLFHLLVPGRQRLLVRYEGLTGDTAEELDRILRFAGTAATRPEPHQPPAYRWKEFHMVGGNPIRFNQGELRLRPDTAWQTDMPVGDRRLVAMLSLPLLVAYGYMSPRRRSRRPERGE